MKTGSCICPVCYRETLAEVVCRAGTYWHCLNRDCGRVFFRAASSDLASDATSSRDDLETNTRYRIPTTVAAQIYELRRMFRL
jgi:hypothetical protein